MQRLQLGVMVLGVLLLLIGGISWWRAAHPPLTAEQQIAANLDDAQRALQNRSAGGVLRYLAPDFSWNNTSRQEFSGMTKGSLFQWRDVQVQRTDEEITVTGNEATSSGTFRISFRSGRDAPLQTMNGTYILHWRLIDSEWKVVKAEGTNPPVAE
jgi:ketosteroid isomerase-like protein